MPVLVERDGKLELEVALPRKGSIPAGFVYIPPGSFLYGAAGDDDIRFNFFGAVPMHRRSLPGFLIGKTEVTIAEWLAFVDQQPPADQAALLPPLAGVSGGRKIERDGAGWRLEMQALDGEYRVRWGEPVVYKGRTKRVRQDWRKFPMTGITPTELARYFAWLERTGKARDARVCTEPEWEYAGRGVDGRDYPHGKPLAPDDANFDLTYGRSSMSIDEVGAHPATTSPFGLLDMSGNAYEWVRPERAEGFFVRSGSFFADRKTANLANRAPMPANFRDATLGARLCATLPPDALR